jgi:hypothetical protein
MPHERPVVPHEGGFVGHETAFVTHEAAFVGYEAPFVGHEPAFSASCRALGQPGPQIVELLDNSLQNRLKEVPLFERFDP